MIKYIKNFLKRVKLSAFVVVTGTAIPVLLDASMENGDSDFWRPVKYTIRRCYIYHCEAK